MRIYVLTSSTQNGKTSAIQAKPGRTNSSSKPSAMPTNETQREDCGAKPDRGGYDHKDGCHLHAEGVHKRVGHRPTDGIRFVVGGEAARGRKGFQQSSGNGNSGEQHGDEQQSAAQEYRGEEPIFEQPVRLRSTAMNQRNASPVKGTKFERDADPVPIGWIGKPDTGVLWVGRDRESDEYQAGDIKRRKNDAADGNDPRGRLRLTSFGRRAAHGVLRSQASIRPVFCHSRRKVCRWNDLKRPTKTAACQHPQAPAAVKRPPEWIPLHFDRGI